jgi:hypothetical protein
VDSLKNKFKGVTVTRLEAGETTSKIWALLGGESPIAASSGVNEAGEAANVKKSFRVEGDNFTLVAEGRAAVRELLTGGVVLPVRGEGPIAIGLKLLAAQGLPNYVAISVAQEDVASDTIDLIFA